MPEIPRKFVSLSIAYVTHKEEMRNGKMTREVASVLAAVADDGTAWLHRGNLESPVWGWEPIVPLPPRTDG